MATKAKYGTGHPEFLSYIQMIVTHPNYSEMPDVRKDDGSIQWEAPSNRSSGKFQFTNRDRRVWWQNQALKVGIDPTSLTWISRTARLIHPTKVKPCKCCGRIMSIYYAYPNRNLLKRFEQAGIGGHDFILDGTEHLNDLAARAMDYYGEQILGVLPTVLATSNITPPTELNTLDDWTQWITHHYIPMEPSTLSPGVMANPPDRLDGFHSFNMSCRGSVDTGRSRENLATYVSDRRAIEYWADGDYVAADKLMGLVRTSLKSHCANPHCNGAKSTADHIGPISLGFMHRPEFDLECRSCNSAAGNRMRQADVQHLLNVEARGEQIISWFNKPLWDLRKRDVVNDETALRLGKLLNEQLNNAMIALNEISEDSHYVFLINYLNLGYSEYNVRFDNLRDEKGRTCYDAIHHTRRSQEYVPQRKARRIRVGFDTLREFASKENRSAYIVTDTEVRRLMHLIKAKLRQVPVATRALDERIQNILRNAPDLADSQLRLITAELPPRSEEIVEFAQAHALLVQVMERIATDVSGLWESEKFARESITSP